MSAESTEGKDHRLRKRARGIIAEPMDNPAYAEFTQRILKYALQDRITFRDSYDNCAHEYVDLLKEVDEEIRMIKMRVET